MVAYSRTDTQKSTGGHISVSQPRFASVKKTSKYHDTPSFSFHVNIRLVVIVVQKVMVTFVVCVRPCLCSILPSSFCLSYTIYFLAVNA